MIAAGFGFRAGAGAESLADAYARACDHTGETADVITTIADKAETPVFQAVAVRLQRPIHPVSDNDISTQTTVTQSSASHTARETGSVAEAAALAAAGPGARLLAPRVISGDRMATCALAESAPI